MVYPSESEVRFGNLMELGCSVSALLKQEAIRLQEQQIGQQLFLDLCRVLSIIQLYDLFKNHFETM